MYRIHLLSCLLFSSFIFASAYYCFRVLCSSQPCAVWHLPEINLESDVLETPDFLWEEDLFKLHYDKTHQYLEVKKRVDIINARLEHLKELYSLLREQQYASVRRTHPIIFWALAFTSYLDIFILRIHQSCQWPV